MSLARAHTAPTVLMPFMAIDRALFRTYEDLGGLRELMLWTSFLVSLCGVYGGYRLGARYGGTAGGLLVGGLVATLPIYAEFTGISKSCSDAWMLGILAIACAATIQGTRRFWASGILLGLAIASRIDMVLAGPLVLWMLWDNQNTEGLWRSALRLAVVSTVSVILAAPWAVLGFVGLLRTIGMARVMGYWTTESPRLTTLKDLAWGQGLGPILVATVIGFFFSPAETRFRRGFLAAFTTLMAATMFTGHYQLMRYHGGPIIALITFAAVAVSTLLQRIPTRIAGTIAAVLLVLPTAQSIRLARHWKSFSAPDAASEWIDQHIPPGTIVYLQCNITVKAILPTESAADAIWHLVADDQAWRKKLEDGSRRFSLSREELPRAMSEDNLCMDRSVSRRWFILGGSTSKRPRYDVRLVGTSATFGLREANLAEEFAKTGGVLVWRSLGWRLEGTSGPPSGLGNPTVKWLNPQGNGTSVFISPDLRAKLKLEN
jgi:hypothetical protein